MSDLKQRIEDLWMEKSRGAFDCAGCGVESTLAMDVLDELDRLTDQIEQWEAEGLRMAKAIDTIYNSGYEGRRQVIEHYGTLHRDPVRLLLTKNNAQRPSERACKGDTAPGESESGETVTSSLPTDDAVPDLSAGDTRAERNLRDLAQAFAVMREKMSTKGSSLDPCDDGHDFVSLGNGSAKCADCREMCDVSETGASERRSGPVGAVVCDRCDELRWRDRPCPDSDCPLLTKGSGRVRCKTVTGWAWRKMITEDCQWLEDQERTLERDHILEIIEVMGRATPEQFLEFRRSVDFPDADPLFTKGSGS